MQRNIAGCVYAMCVVAAVVDNYVRAASAVLADANAFRNQLKAILISEYISDNLRYFNI